MSGGGCLVERLRERVPAEHGALDAHRELHDALQCLEVAERDLRVTRLLVDSVDGHQGLEPTDQRLGLTGALALHRLGHHRGGRLRDRAALAGDLDVGDRCVVAGVPVGLVEQEVDRDLVTAQRVVAVGLDRRRCVQLATVPGRAVVIEDDLAVEVFEARHQNPKISVAPSSASASASTSSVSLYRYRLARVVALTPSVFISGLAQWWPARTHTLRSSSTWLTSCGCRSRNAKLITPPRCSTLSGP